MKILVCISKVPDTTASIRFSDDGQSLMEDGVQFIVNPYDDWYALVRSIELIEQYGGELVLLHVGPAANDSIIRKALALGGDYAVRIDKAAENALDTASQIAAYIKNTGQAFDLIIGGKETISYNNGAVLGMVAEMLDVPYIAAVSSLDYEGNTFRMTRDVQGGVETLEAENTIVLSAIKGMSEQKTPSMKGILGAKKKTIEVVEPKALDESKNKVEKYETIPPKSACRMMTSIPDLVDALENEAKVLNF